MTLFEIAKPAASLEEEGSESIGEAGANQITGSEPPTNQNGGMIDLNAGRFVRYQFTPQVRKV